jgi:trehalose synthase
MRALTSVPVPALSTERFASVLDAEAYERFDELARGAGERFAGRVVWNVNSTPRGGGVAEMLQSLLAYARGAGVDARWEVIRGDPEFFRITKRIHNRLHGAPGDDGGLGAAERQAYEAALASNASELLELVSQDDVVILHDPQTAGLVPPLKEAGVPVIWRCHVGIDSPNELAREAWAFLVGYVRDADACVFSRRAFAWEGLDEDRIALIAPSIDAFSAKNQDLDARAVAAILGVAGLQQGPSGHGAAEFMRQDGSPAHVVRQAELYQEAPVRPDDRVVVQVSRWDRLKDPLGVMEGFVDHVAGDDAHLVLAGPSVEAVTDDPEGAEVLAEVREKLEGLDPTRRARVHLAGLPMDDLEENAAIVNALQRRADVIVQKSLAEGFGLTVAEGMWKGRPVVASRIGGIQDQIVDGENGVLLNDPLDLEEFGGAVRRLLDDPEAADAMGRKARQRIGSEFLGVRSLMQYLDLIERLERERPAAVVSETELR